MRRGRMVVIWHLLKVICLLLKILLHMERKRMEWTEEEKIRQDQQKRRVQSIDTSSYLIICPPSLDIVVVNVRIG